MVISIDGVDNFTWRIEDKEVKQLVPAYVFASENLLEKIKKDGSLRQLVNVSTLKGIVGSAIAMPDIHQGYGFPIGGVAAFDHDEGLVSPGGVGYDINCGVSLLSTSLKRGDIDGKVKYLIDSLFESIPAGMGKRGLSISRRQMDEILMDGLQWTLENGYAEDEDLTHTENGGKLEVSSLAFISRRAMERGITQLMTLGSGNHFLEIQYVDKIYDERAARSFGIDSEGQITVMIHTGSRGFGHQVATDFLNTIYSGAEGTHVPAVDRQLAYAHIKSRTAERYIESMSAAANYAYVNRQLIVDRVRRVFHKVLGKPPSEIGMKLVYSLAHNIARIEEHRVDGVVKKVVVHRKGATRAFPPSRMAGTPYSEFGHPVLIPGDMGTASYVLAGVEDNLERAFGSSCHGAGRNMGRREALRSFTASQINQALLSKGITARAARKNVLIEEAPNSYKNVDEVVRAAEGAKLARVVARLVPIGVMKG